MTAPEIARPAWKAGALAAILFVAGWLLDGLLFTQGSAWTPAAWAILASCLACFAGAITAFVFWCIRAWLREETDMIEPVGRDAEITRLLAAAATADQDADGEFPGSYYRKAHRARARRLRRKAEARTTVCDEES